VVDGRPGIRVRTTRSSVWSRTGHRERTSSSRGPPTLPEIRRPIGSVTITYSVDLLKSHYRRSIVDYGKAERHMAMMADMLSRGIIAQFPRKFSG
jgi:hypothetical protein